MKLELRRLLCRDVTLPSFTIVDATAIERYCLEHSRSAPWERLVCYARRASLFRQVTFIVAPTTTAPPSSLDLLEVHRTLALQYDDVLWWGEPVVTLLTPPQSPTTVLTAGVEERPWELVHLRFGRSVVLDVATGRLWTHEEAVTTYSDLQQLGFWSAVAMHEKGEKPIVREATKAQYADDLLRYRGPIGELTEITTKRIASRVAEKKPELETCGWQRTGILAPVEPRVFSATCTTLERDDTVYLTWARRDGRDRVVMSHSSNGGHLLNLDDAETLSRFMREVRHLTAKETRWFIPRAFDTLRAMREYGLSPPKHVVDPAMAAYVLHPDDPPSLSEVHPPLMGLDRRLLRWMEDRDGETEISPGQGLLFFHQVLPSLDRALTTRLEERGQRSLVEYDLSQTLPVLADIEEHGVLIGPPPVPWLSWEAVRESVEGRYRQLYHCHARSLNIDPLRATYAELLKAGSAQWSQLPPDRDHRTMIPKRRFERYAELGNQAAVDILALKSFYGGVKRWLHLLEEGEVLRGTTRPTRSGRFTFGDIALHNIPKGTELLLGGFVATPGQILLHVDYRAFEPRLLASYSADPLLMAASQDAASASADLYAILNGKLASHLPQGLLKRELIKAGMLAVFYGSKRDAFACRQHQLTIAEAHELFDSLSDALVGVRCLRRQVDGQFGERGEVWTRSGWRREPNDPRPARRRRQAFNTLIQGTGADILRFVLRVLQHELKPHGARLVFHHHDAVIVSCPQSELSRVKELIRDVMERRARRAGYLAADVPLPVDIKEGRTWRDIV